MKYIKFNLSFLIIFIGLNYIYFNFGKNKFNFQIESFLKENLKKALIQFIKFGTVGAINTVLSYAITNGAYYLLHLHEQISNIIAFVITVFISFIKNMEKLK